VLPADLVLHRGDRGDPPRTSAAAVPENKVTGPGRGAEAGVQHHQPRHRPGLAQQVDQPVRRDQVGAAVLAHQGQHALVPLGVEIPVPEIGIRNSARERPSGRRPAVVTFGSRPTPQTDSHENGPNARIRARARMHVSTPESWRTCRSPAARLDRHDARSTATAPDSALCGAPASFVRDASGSAKARAARHRAWSLGACEVADGRRKRSRLFSMRSPPRGGSSRRSVLDSPRRDDPMLS